MTKYVYFNSPDEYKGIIYEPGRVTRIKLNRPRYLNAISHPTYAEIDDAFERFANDPEAKVAVLSGEGNCFCAGHDAMGLTPESAPMLADRRTPEQLMKQFGSEREVWLQYDAEHRYFLFDLHLFKLHKIPKPTIAMVHGYCVYGGFALAGIMDVLFASEDALFLGVTGQTDPGTWDMGVRKTMEVMLEHRFMTARECYEWRMINRIFPDYETLERETLAFAERVADNMGEGGGNPKAGLHHTRDVQGYSRALEENWNRGDWKKGGRIPLSGASGHGMRYEGRGIARAPRALANLKAKLESEGEEVPKLVIEALNRANSRDDAAVWQKALHQEWRDQERIKRAEAEAKAHEEKQKEKK
jgi:enoyl-CoA hydratase